MSHPLRGGQMRDASSNLRRYEGTFSVIKNHSASLSYEALWIRIGGPAKNHPQRTQYPHLERLESDPTIMFPQ